MAVKDVRSSVKESDFSGASCGAMDALITGQRLGCMGACAAPPPPKDSFRVALSAVLKLGDTVPLWHACTQLVSRPMPCHALAGKELYDKAADAFAPLPQPPVRKLLLSRPLLMHPNTLCSHLFCPTRHACRLPSCNSTRLLTERRPAR